MLSCLWVSSLTILIVLRSLFERDDRSPWKDGHRPEYTDNVHSKEPCVRRWGSSVFDRCEHSTFHPCCTDHRRTATSHGFPDRTEFVCNSFVPAVSWTEPQYWQHVFKADWYRAHHPVWGYFGTDFVANEAKWNQNTGNMMFKVDWCRAHHPVWGYFGTYFVANESKWKHSTGNTCLKLIDVGHSTLCEASLGQIL